MLQTNNNASNDDIQNNGKSIIDQNLSITKNSEIDFIDNQSDDTIVSCIYIKLVIYFSDILNYGRVCSSRMSRTIKSTYNI